MSAQQRYRTLVQSIVRIYAAPEGKRTELLQDALDEIMSVIGPISASQWCVVNADTDRLLKVWAAKEKDEAAVAVVEQLTDILRELMAAPCITLPPIPAPVLCVKDEIIQHVPALLPVKVMNPEPVTKAAIEAKGAPAPALKIEVKAAPPKPVVPAVVVAVKKVVEVEEEVEEEVVEEETEEEEEEVVEEEEDQSPEEEEEVVEEEVVEEEAEEEEEAGLEVEQMTWRGRTYWRDVNTNKIYAVVDEDDVGDEIGELVNGKVALYAK
jgi:hypothetical protein